LENTDDGNATRAWVFNAVANSVSLVDVSDAANPTTASTIPLQDPTHSAMKRGRIAFETASASTTGTYSCASCHPDQLLWVLRTPIVTGGSQIMPRSTMPVRGLRDTEPYHWDGIPGDPYGGNNSANVHGSDEPNSFIFHVKRAHATPLAGLISGQAEYSSTSRRRETILPFDPSGMLSARLPPAPQRSAARRKLQGRKCRSVKFSEGNNHRKETREVNKPLSRWRRSTC